MADNDKKRHFSAVDSLPQLPAKRPLQQLSEDGPLTQQDVVYFKKEAIWRQMNLYKLQAHEFQREISKHEKRYLAFLAVHLLLENWYKLVVSAYKQDDETVAALDLSLPQDEIELILEKRRSTLVALLLLPASATLEENLVKFSDILTLKTDKDKAEQLQSELKEKIAHLQLLLDEALKENDRKESKTLLRVSTNNHIKTEEPQPASNGQANTSKDPELEANLQPDLAQKHELEDLKIELAQIKAGNQSLEERLSLALSDQAKAEASVLDLTHKLNDLDDTDLLKSRRYLALLDQKNSLAEYAAQVTSINEELTNKLRCSDEKEGNFVRSVSRELEEENHRLKELLTKAESDLVRVRTVRDELLGKQIVLKLEAENKATNEELVKVNELLNERLKSLEAQKEKAYDSNSAGSLELLEKPELIKRLHVLNEELKDIEKAFQSTREVNLARLREVADREGLMKKLNIEKNKADQKYFASMRLKDLLTAENKVLKSQVAKSQELVTKLSDLEKTYVSKVDLLTKSVDEYRAIKESSMQENAKLQETIKKFTKVREHAGKEIHLLKEELGKAKKEGAEAAAELGVQKTKESKLEAKLRATENLLAKYKQNNTSSILQEDEKQLEALRSITKCSVCSKNWKNTAITACGHVFCDGCVQERLAARLRRCPTCNKGFSSNDLLSIHL
ncbi:BRE1-domain-containing protein [Metschnikowia bicuspidata var. bicuspidata NRRL YB-4993]|uniref:E3 ubiquitin protein ligase n=1 Tax=Metschnikowia bicuspidata var. bicuspidata NRRL YB-4993 TaxID=869754 RepID=A0A1A0HAL6_9ASCO|nr:BRE1-domain-containing protein [Metschnikowia bicuspidata var. bicuspidata NRRL YB-4993]OBA21045.1 BRE1-domain-containing protein [Metschnikowia bicuspidata var. bicuspidata NRRL YB-4993]